jgi:hypothetical protein
VNPSPPGNENATRQGGALRTDYAVQNIPVGGFTRKEYAAIHGVNVRTVARWIRVGRLIFTRTPGGQPRIHGVRP